MLALIAAACALAAWLLWTPSGLRWIATRAHAWLPETVSFSAVDGRLAGPLELDGLVVRGAGVTVRIDRIELSWSPAALLAGRVQIDRAAVSGVDVELAAASDGGNARGPARPALPDGLAPPVPVDIDALTVADIRIRPGTGEPVTVSRIALTVRAGRRRIRLERFAVQAPAGTVDASGTVATTAPFAVDLGVDWSIQPPGDLPETGGHLDLGGRLGRLRFVQELRQPTAARIEGRLEAFGAMPRWRAHLDLPPTRPGQWWPAVPAGTIAASLDLDGTFRQVAAKGTVDVDAESVGSVRARLELAASPDSIRIQRLALEPARRPGARVTASGRLALDGGPPRADIALDWDDLGWPLAAPGVTSPDGHATITGTVDAYELAGAAGVDLGNGLGRARVRWQASGSTDGLDPLELHADWRDARATATGHVHWRAPGVAHFDIGVENVDPARLELPASGTLAADAGIDVAWSGPVQLRADIRRIAGTVNDRPVRGRGRVEYAADTLRIVDARLDVGDAELRASGRLAERAAIDWQVAVPELGGLLPGASGHLTARGQVTGRATAPRVQLDLSASGLRWRDLAAAGLEVHGTVATAPDEETSMVAETREVVVGGVRSAHARFDLSGTRGQHHLQARVASEYGDADVVLAGRAERGAWSGQLRRAVLTPRGQSAWRLAGPAPVSWRAGEFGLSGACWEGPGGRLCAQVSGQGSDWRLAVDGHDLPLAIAGAYAPDTLAFDGRCDLSASLELRGAALTGTARVDLAPGRVRGTLGDQEETLLEYGRGHAEATIARDRVDAMVELPLAGGGHIAATIGVGLGTPSRIAGQLRLDARDLGLLAALVPQVGAVDGTLTADLQFDGTTAAPGVSGEMRLQDGRVSILPLGIDVTGLSASVGSARGGIDVQVTGHSGSGDLRADMRFARAGEGWTGRGSIRGEVVTAADLPEARIVVSPDLQWRVEDHTVHVSGDVTVPEARLAPRDLSGTVQTTPDAVIVGPAAQKGAAPDEPAWRVVADVRVHLGDAVHLEAFGLTGRLAGDIRIREQPEQLTSATGELRVVDGTYTIYRQTLTIERGRVLFDGGPVADPGLDVRAVRKPQDVVVGVNVRGTLRKPEVSLFSEPAMQQSQLLSYLIVGVPLGETSSNERSSVATAASALASSREGTRIAGELGIQSVSVEDSADTQGASLVLGRYLSPRLYVGYGIGLLDQANSVRMRYELTRTWTVEARSGVNQSADLLYSIER